MPKRARGLTARGVATMRDPGMFADGGGLYLRVSATGARSWIFRYQIAGRRRDMGLGPVEVFSLADARQRAADARRQVAEGRDPIAARDARLAAERLADATAMTFKQCAEAYIKAMAAGWSNGKSEAQWRATLATYAYPEIGGLPVQTVDTGAVLRVVEPIWSTKNETASRLRGRIERILDWARTRGYREGENPARWRGHLDNLLPARSRVQKVEHHAALPWREVPAFMAELRQAPGTGARALEFAILTAARTGEVIGADWSEIDLDDAVWTVPAGRMKAGREHRVPLAPAAVALLEAIAPAEDQRTGFVFPGMRNGRPLSNMAMLAALKRLGRGDLTAHGFRSSFRDWCADATTYPNHVAEQALAHTIGSAVEAAYRRTDLFDQRRRLMADWSAFCAGAAPVGGVVPMRRGA